MDIFNGKKKRVIINIPPGYSKTMMVVISFISWCLAKVPMARFLHLSYSSSLALENSSMARNIIKSEEYRKMWDIPLKDDSDSKQKWWTHESGGVYATSAGGQVTGFRAGHMGDGFTGALIIDDPVKPDDADYEERKRVNNRFNETIKSRLAHEDIPIIIIMQRIHKNDLSGYLLRGGSGEKWHHLNLPVFSSKESYPSEYTHGIEIRREKNYGWLWDFKHSEKNKIELQSHKRAYWCQYMQQPEKYKVDGALWSEELIAQYRIYDTLPQYDRIVVGVDPSGDDGSDESKSDAIGIIVCASYQDRYYVLCDGTLNGSPKQWAEKAVSLYNRYEADIIVGEKNYGGAMVKHTIRSVDGGDRARYKDVVASRGKLLRAEPIVALYEHGKVHHVGVLNDLEEELCSYDGKGSSQNRLDALVWALTELSGGYNAEISAPTVSLFT